MNVNLINSQELMDLILKFTMAVNVDKPKNLINFAAVYFNELAREQHLKHHPQRGPSSTSQFLGSGLSPNEAQSKSPSPSPEPPRNRMLRRQSISLEKYEVDMTDEIVVVPKSNQQKEYLMKIIQEIILFRALDKEQLHLIIETMKERRVGNGEKIMEQGEIVENFFVIEKGIFESSVQMEGNTRRVCMYENNGCFGEIALLYNQPSAYTIISKSDGILWTLDRNTYKKVVAESAIRKQKTYEVFIRQVPLLSALTEHEKMNLVCAFKCEFFEDGDYVIKEGEKSDKMYFIEKGSVLITIIREKKTSILLVGDYFGELSLIFKKPLPISAVAKGFTKLATLDVDTFERLLGPYMDILKRYVVGNKHYLLNLLPDN